jgi:hypothetical protein
LMHSNSTDYFFQPVPAAIEAASMNLNLYMLKDSDLNGVHVQRGLDPNRKLHPMTRAILVGFFAAIAAADTVTTSDELSVNGSLVKMSEGVIQLEVSSRSGKKLRWIPMKKVGSIEFNSTVFNPGGPPKVFGIKPPVEQEKAPPKAAERPTQGGTIVLRGGESKPCKLVSIDAAKVHCDSAEWGRPIVLRILVSPR